MRAEPRHSSTNESGPHYLVQVGPIVLVVAVVTELSYRFLWSVDHPGVEAEVEHPQHGPEHGPDQDEGDGLNHPDCQASNFFSESKHNSTNK